MTSWWPISESETFGLAWAAAWFGYCFIRDGVRWYQNRPPKECRAGKLAY